MARLSNLIRTSRRLALAGLAAGLATFATADVASAQRQPAGDVWQGASTRFAPQRTCPPVIDTRTPRNYRGGYYETRYERVWVPATTRREWVPAQYGYRYLPCGTRVRYLVQGGHYRSVHVPGYYDRQAVRVWVPARRQVVRDTRRVHRVDHIGRRRR